MQLSAVADDTRFNQPSALQDDEPAQDHCRGARHTIDARGSPARSPTP
ncbi:MAG: hypothetical protein R3A10_17925 [Caldilineaceae bacterium]